MAVPNSSERQGDSVKNRPVTPPQGSNLEPLQCHRTCSDRSVAVPNSSPTGERQGDSVKNRPAAPPRGSNLEPLQCHTTCSDRSRPMAVPNSSPTNERQGDSIKNCPATPPRGSNLEPCNAIELVLVALWQCQTCLLYTSPSPRDASKSRMPSSA